VSSWQRHAEADVLRCFTNSSDGFGETRFSSPIPEWSATRKLESATSWIPTLQRSHHSPCHCPQILGKQLIQNTLPLIEFTFGIFSPKIACQAPKPPNSLKQNKIELAF
jgi:hypothetical protein